MVTGRLVSSSSVCSRRCARRRRDRSSGSRSHPITNRSRSGDRSRRRTRTTTALESRWGLQPACERVSPTQEVSSCERTAERHHDAIAVGHDMRVSRVVATLCIVTLVAGVTSLVVRRLLTARPEFNTAPWTQTLSYVATSYGVILGFSIIFLFGEFRMHAMRSATRQHRSVRPSTKRSCSPRAEQRSSTR